MDEEDILYDNDGTFIHKIQLPELPGLDGRRWVKKIRRCYFANEATIIKSHLLGCKSAVQIPPIEEWHGVEEDSYNKMYWYIMEEYDGSIYKNMLFAKENWKRLLIDVISFLKHLHKQGLVHGDIKDMNILFRREPYPRFYVADYEFVRRPGDDDTVCSENDETSFYYSLMGCEKGQPHFSYKLDLMSFGYLLWKVFEASVDKMGHFDWQRYALYEYKHKNGDYTLDYIDAQRRMENVFMPPFIEKYFSICESIDCHQKEPPDWALYDELMRLEGERNKGEGNIFYRKKDNAVLESSKND